VYDFLFVIIELFSLALTVKTLPAEICRSERFLKGVGHFDRPLRVEGDRHWGRRPPTAVEWQKTRRTALLCGRLFELVTKHACDRRTDGRTDGRTNRITTPKITLA